MTPIKLEGDDEDEDDDGGDGDGDEDEGEDEESTPVPRSKRHASRWVFLLRFIPYAGKLSRILTRMNVRALSEKLLRQSLVR
jgi:hypothetical protein